MTGSVDESSCRPPGSGRPSPPARAARPPPARGRLALLGDARLAEPLGEPGQVGGTRARGSPRSPGRARGRRPRGRGAPGPSRPRCRAARASGSGGSARRSGARRRRPSRCRAGEHGHLRHHAQQRVVPLDRVVAPRLPRVDQHRLAEPAGRAPRAGSGASRAAGRAARPARRSSGWSSKRSRMQVAASGGWVMPEMRRPSDAQAPPPPARPGQVAGVRAGRPSSAARAAAARPDRGRACGTRCGGSSPGGRARRPASRARSRRGPGRAPPSRAPPARSPSSTGAGRWRATAPCSRPCRWRRITGVGAVRRSVASARGHLSWTT